MSEFMNSSLVQDEDFLPLGLVEDDLLLLSLAAAFAVFLQMTGRPFANDDSTAATN